MLSVYRVTCSHTRRETHLPSSWHSQENSKDLTRASPFWCGENAKCSFTFYPPSTNCTSNGNGIYLKYSLGNGIRSSELQRQLAIPTNAFPHSLGSLSRFTVNWNEWKLKETEGDCQRKWNPNFNWAGRAASDIPETWKKLQPDVLRCTFEAGRKYRDNQRLPISQIESAILNVFEYIMKAYVYFKWWSIYSIRVWDSRIFTEPC